MHRAFLLLLFLRLIASTAFDAVPSTERDASTFTRSTWQGQSEQNTSEGHLVPKTDPPQGCEHDKHDRDYEYMARQTVDGNECSMDAAVGTMGRGRAWNDVSSYFYHDDPCVLKKCKDLCDAQPDCAGFVDTIFTGRDNPMCLFKTSTATKSGTLTGVNQRDLYIRLHLPTPILPPPAPSPPPGSTCLGGWPQFSSSAELASDPWGNYFRTLYGSMPSFSYPLCIGDFWHFYDDLISSTGAMAPAIAGNCPTKDAPEGERYVENNMYQPAGVSYAWHGPTYAAVEEHTWVEVSHKADPFGDEQYGLWFLYAKGNGIWFNTGKTRHFAEHSDAFSEFGVPNGGNMNEGMSQAASAENYNSIQFTRHHDHVNYPCDTAVNPFHPGTRYMNLEILAVQLSGTYACGGANGAPIEIKAGWQGSETCDCDTSKPTLNCRNFATHTEVV